MNIDEKIKNNWYLEQDEINTLIKRYRTMKYVNYVLLLIISVLLLTGCGIFSSDGSEKEEFEPYQVGAWEIVSPKEAEWVGKQIYSKNRPGYTMDDTITIEQPGQRSLRLWKEENQLDEQFMMEFIDSTASEQSIDGRISPVFYNPSGNGNYPIHSNGYETFIGSERMKTEFDMATDCRHNFDSNNPVIHIAYEYHDQDGRFRTYAIHVNGMIEAVNNIVCN